VDDIPKVLGGLGMTIISTSKGLMAGHKAKKEKIGGELIASVW
jgi:small subunit ribosomal protein S8